MSKPSIAVIGTSFGGLAAVIELKRLGHDDIVVFEKADDVGGVWRENTYPGADKYDVRRHVRFGTEVAGASFDEATGKWTVELGTGEQVVVDVLVSAVGQLSGPDIPACTSRTAARSPRTSA